MNKKLLWKLILREYCLVACEKRRKSIQDIVAATMLQERCKKKLLLCSVVLKYTFGVLVLDLFDIFGACDKSFKNFPLSQPAFNTCEVNWLQSAMLQLHSLFPIFFFLTEICSQGIVSGLWTESGWQSLAISLSSEYCLFWPTSWILLVFHCLPFFFSVFSGKD